MHREGKREGKGGMMANVVCSSNSDVYLGYVGWSAGNFAENYVLSMTPSENGGVWTDASIVSSCLKR